MSLNKFCSSNRIKKKKDFSSVFNSGRKKSFSNFFIYSKKSSLEDSRIGIIVSKKASKKAVVRNNIKRHVREFFRNSSFFNNTSLDIIFIFNRNPKDFLKDPKEFLNMVIPVL